MSSRALEYNLAESRRNGWNASILGEDKIDEQFCDVVKSFQVAHGLTADGMLGPATFRRILAERDSKYSAPTSPTGAGVDYIICNGNKVPVKGGVKVLTWQERGGLTINGGYSTGSRTIKHFVTHWDAALSAKSCRDILQQRGLAVHFLIDNDGTIYQLVDTAYKAFHAGDANSSSIGVEVSNAYYTKYNDWYERNGFGRRRVLPKMKIETGYVDEHLDFYDAQYEALAALWEAVSRAHNIPLVLPSKMDGVISWSGFEGFMNHFHITSKKIDCYGIDHQRVLNKAIQLSRT
jgi:hypothetical protein